MTISFMPPEEIDCQVDGFCTYKFSIRYWHAFTDGESHCYWAEKQQRKHTSLQQCQNQHGSRGVLPAGFYSGVIAFDYVNSICTNMDNICDEEVATAQYTDSGSVRIRTAYIKAIREASIDWLENALWIIRASKADKHCLRTFCSQSCQCSNKGFHFLVLRVLPVDSSVALTARYEVEHEVYIPFSSKSVYKCVGLVSA